MIARVDRIETEVGPLQVVVFNIGANVRFLVLDTTAQVYSQVWEMAALEHDSRFRRNRVAVPSKTIML